MKKAVTMHDIFKNPRYRGKHIILAAGRVYTANTGDGALEILKKLEKKHPNIVPEIAYLPKARHLSFFHRTKHSLDLTIVDPMIPASVGE